MNKKTILLLAVSGCLLASCGGVSNSSSSTSSSSSSQESSASSSSSSSIPAVKVEISGEKTVVAGDTITLTAVVTNATDASVTWESADKKIATVDKGVVSGLSVGSVVITAASVADPTKKATVTVSVTAPSLDFAALFTATNNFTLDLKLGEVEKKVIVSEEGMFVPSMFHGVIIKTDPDKAYVFSQRKDGKYYYTNSSGVKNDDGTEMSVTAVKAQLLWSYWIANVGAFAFGGLKDGGATFSASLPADSPLGSIACSFFRAETETTVPTLTIEVALKKDKTLGTLAIGGVAENDVAVSILDEGTSALGVTPIWTLDEGEEAGDGTGEDWGL